MKSVRREDTAAELQVRRFLHGCGLRFSLHVAGLPGKPDIVLPHRQSVVFVHGCFWHGHHCRHGSVRSKTNAEFWAKKIADNRMRDQRKAHELRKLGWHVETIWECQLGDEGQLMALAFRLLAR